MSSLADRHPELLLTQNWPAPFPRRGWMVASNGVDMLFAYRTNAKWLGYEGRAWLPLMFEVLIVERPTLPPRCQLRIGITAKGPSCLRLTLNGSVAEPLTAAGIRLPLRELVDEVVDQAALLGEERLPTKAEREAFAGELAATFPRAEPGKRLPDELLEEVARVYRYALQRGLPPTEAVKEALDVSRSTAGRYVVRARRAGLLGRASPGVAGELEPKGGNNG